MKEGASIKNSLHGTSMLSKEIGIVRHEKSSIKAVVTLLLNLAKKRKTMITLFSYPKQLTRIAFPYADKSGQLSKLDLLLLSSGFDHINADTAKREKVGKKQPALKK